MKIGFCRTCISPPIGTKLGGYASRVDPSIGILDDLYSRCIAIEYNDEVIAIVVLDILGIPRDLWKEIASKIARELGIPIDNVLIIATHTHSGPSLEFDPIYRSYLVKNVIGCTKCAYNHMSRVDRAIIAQGLARDAIYNRRNPSRGAVDPDLYTVVLEGIDRLALINFTCHPVVLGPNNLYISADYPGALIKYFAQLTNIDKTLFINGCAGNINPYTSSTDLSKPYNRRGSSYDEVLSYGYMLALEATKSLYSTKNKHVLKLDSIDIGYVYRDIELKLRIPIKDIQELENLLREAEKRSDFYKVWEYRKALTIVKNYGSREYLEFRIAVLKIGKDIVFIFMPAEVFVEHQLYIKKESPF
ncbi:MAG TPA: hypothetical protein ENF93_01990, partial [Ignisphaera sp.]|nr:hypothetical protein [Ignisphaera sp.]